MSNHHLTKQHGVMEILEDLVRIQSVNPFYGRDARGEGELADYIESRCKKAGLTVSRQEVFPGRDNIIAELRTGHSDNTLLFEAHMDTVSLGSMVDPLIPKQDGDRFYGRGACDTKGSLAGMLYAMETCAKNPENLSCDLVLCASVDEEHEFRGLLKFLELDIPVSGAVVGEPTETSIVVAHKGCARFSIKTHGKAAHSSVPEKGSNAIYHMAEIIHFIQEEYAPSLAQNNHELCGQPTIVVAQIHGGTQINIVPESCEIEIDRRIIPGEDPAQVMDDLQKQLTKKFKHIELTIEEHLLDWPLNTPIDSQVIQCSQKVASNLMLNSQLQGVGYSSNASKLQGIKGIPSIVFGPGSIDQAHSKKEWVSIQQVEKAAAFYLELANQYGRN